MIKRKIKSHHARDLDSSILTFKIFQIQITLIIVDLNRNKSIFQHII